MNGSSTQVSEGEVLYAAGYIRHFLETYARSSTLSSDELAYRVAALLLAQTGREILGPLDTVPNVRSKSAKRSKATRKVALAGSAHGKARRPMSKARRLIISRAQKKRWAKIHAEQAA